MKTLREYVKEVEEKKVAIGHFNISNLEGFHGVYNAAKNLNMPVVIGLSEGGKFCGQRRSCFFNSHDP
jgi:fructose-bisphosphate aldolase, class II